MGNGGHTIYCGLLNHERPWYSSHFWGFGTGKGFNQWAGKSTHKSDKWIYWEPSKWKIKNYVKITRYPDLWNGGWIYKYYLDQTNVLIHMMNQTVVTHQVHEIVLVQQMQFPSLRLPSIKPASLHCTSFHHDCLELHLPLRKDKKRMLEICTPCRGDLRSSVILCSV